MRRDVYTVISPSIGAGRVIAYGHYGKPMIVFPSDAGAATDFEDRGMVDAVAGLIDAGRVTLYCVDSYDQGSWRDNSLSLEERARRHGLFEDWVVNQVVPLVYDDCGGERLDIMLAGCSLGA